MTKSQISKAVWGDDQLHGEDEWRLTENPGGGIILQGQGSGKFPEGVAGVFLDC